MNTTKKCFDLTGLVAASMPQARATTLSTEVQIESTDLTNFSFLLSAFFVVAPSVRNIWQFLSLIFVVLCFCVFLMKLYKVSLKTSYLFPTVQSALINKVAHSLKSPQLAHRTPTAFHSVFLLFTYLYYILTVYFYKTLSCMLWKMS